jgi:hypothetical protein
VTRTSLASLALSVVLLLHLVALAVAVTGGAAAPALVAEAVGLAAICAAWPPEPPPVHRAEHEAAAARERDQRHFLCDAILDVLRTPGVPREARARLIQALTADAVAGGAA